MKRGQTLSEQPKLELVRAEESPANIGCPWNTIQFDVD